MKQKTIQQQVLFQGIGVHNGLPSSVTVQPAPADTGLVFVHALYPNEPIRVGCVVPEIAPHATVLCAQSWAISTVEHLLAALYVLGIDNAYLLVDGTEIPILDGSAYPFVQRFLAVGLLSYEQDRVSIIPKKPLLFSHGNRRLELLPQEEVAVDKAWQLDVTYTADFPSLAMGAASVAYRLHDQEFIDWVAPARTFGFLAQLPLLRAHGLAQGSSLGNTVVMGQEGLLNAMRVPDECIRHKVLDLVGDLTLLGGYLDARIVATNTGHAFNRLVIQHFLEHPVDWMVR